MSFVTFLAQLKHDSSSRAACGSVAGHLLVQLTAEGNKQFFFLPIFLHGNANKSIIFLKLQVFSHK
jgi:hypothetical protein